MSAPRYALYLAPPPGDPWDRFGSGWLGRSAYGHGKMHQPAIPGLDLLEQARLTAAPRRYGFHATLMAPIALCGGADADAIAGLARDVSSRHQAFELPDLHADWLDDFLALRPLQPDARVQALADDCVRSIQGVRAPLSESALARRRAAGLDSTEDALLLRWGYPWVMQRFRLHFSLTGALQAPDHAAGRALLEAARAALPAHPMPVDALCLFEEPAPGADFRCIARYALRP